MRSKGKDWTKEETMLAFELYCIIPKGKDTATNPLIIELAAVIGRSVNSVKLKLQNFKSCDPSYTADGKVGLKNVATLAKEVCFDFLDNWDALIYETNEIRKQFNLPEREYEEEKEIQHPAGLDRLVTRKERVGQSFFRKALLAAYDHKCCFTGIAIPELLRASHIKPWSDSNDTNEKTNPRNGLLLNALHDAAFDKGFITITVDYRILIAKDLLERNYINDTYFIPLHENTIELPSRFYPDKKFIVYHNNKFRG